MPVRLNMLMHCPAPLGLRTCLLFLALPLWTIADSQETADYTASVERIKAAGGDVVVSEAYASSSGIREILADLGAPKLALNGTVRCVSSCLSPGPGHGTMKGAVIPSSHSVGVGWLKKHGSFVSALMVAIVLMLPHRRVSNSCMVVCVSLDAAHAFTPFCRSSLLPHALCGVRTVCMSLLRTSCNAILCHELRPQGGKVATEMARMLAPSGTLVTYGSATPGLTVPASALTGKDLILRGFSMQRWLETVSRAEAEGMVAELAEAGLGSSAVSKVKFGNLLDVLGEVRAGGGGYVAVMPEGEQLMMK